MITILTSFKPFVGEAAVHQTNALRSWKALATDVEILVFGEPRAFGPFVEPLGARVVPDVPFGEDGRARVDAIFQFGERHGKHNQQAYVNGDILLTGGFAETIRAIRLRRFLMIGRRTNVDVTEPLSFETERSAREATKKLRLLGRLDVEWALDYFAYSRGSIPNLPPLYLGAAGWDNLMVYHCRRSGIAVIDATRDVTAFHQNHSYYGMKECPSAQANLAQAPDPACFFGAHDASHWLKHGQVRSAWASPHYTNRIISNYPVARGWPKSVWFPFRLTARVLARAGYV